MDVEFVVYDGFVVLDVYDEEEDEGEGEGDLCVFEEFDEGSWEVERFDCVEKEDESDCEEDVFVLVEYDY